MESVIDIHHRSNDQWRKEWLFEPIIGNFWEEPILESHQEVVEKET